MNRPKHTLSALTIAGLLACSMTTHSHTTILSKNGEDGKPQRTEWEGNSSVLNHFVISHGCASPGSHDVKPVRAMSVVFPNGRDSQAKINETGDPINLSDVLEGNAIMAAKPVQNRDIFKRTQTFTGPVPEYKNHGIKTEDSRAFAWSNGKLQTNLIGLVPFRASFPTFKPDSCASVLHINFAIANYCSRSKTKANRADIWMGELTPLFNDPAVVSVGFWPTLKIKRDLANNPLPNACGKGIEITVTPSPQSVDRFLPQKHYWPN